MFSVTIALFFLLLISEYVQKANELVRKQQKPAQSQYGILEASMIKFHFDNILLVEAMLTDSLAARKISKKKRVQNIG